MHPLWMTRMKTNMMMSKTKKMKTSLSRMIRLKRNNARRRRKRKVRKELIKRGRMKMTSYPKTISTLSNKVRDKGKDSLKNCTLKNLRKSLGSKNR
jgi:hypothetical protein